MADPQTLIREAQEKAERLCRLAVAQTPADYQSFITLIEQRKKVGGTRAAPIWATVRQPYLSADGRVKHAQVVTVIDILRRENVTKFAINTSPLEEKAK